jgi:hypothetical protein
MEDEMRHHNDAHEVINAWGTFMSMMGEEEFNKMLAPYMVLDEKYQKNAHEAFHSFHKGMRQGDTFDCFVRTKNVPDVNAKSKGRTKSVIDEHINGQIESLIWTMVHLDKSDAFQKTFKFYWGLHQQDTPVAEFVFEKKSSNDWDDGYNGLAGVRVVGKEEFLTKKQFDEMYPGLDDISFMIEHGVKQYLWNSGKEVKPKDAGNWTSLKHPIGENGKDVEYIIAWESRTETPFKFIQTILIPEPQKA